MQRFWYVVWNYWLRKIHSLKVESYVRTLSLRGSISSNPERTALRRLMGEPGYVEVMQQKAGNLNVKWLLLKGKQIPQVKEFSAFLLICMERCKSLGSLKSVLWCAPQPSGASIPVFTSRVLPAPWGRGCRLLAAGWQEFFPSWASQGSSAHHPWCWQSQMTVTSFVDMAGNTPFLRIYFLISIYCICYFSLDWTYTLESSVTIWARNMVKSISRVVKKNFLVGTFSHKLNATCRFSVWIAWVI